MDSSQPGLSSISSINNDCFAHYTFPPILALVSAFSSVGTTGKEPIMNWKNIQKFF
jgi:hypothetical protein